MFVLIIADICQLWTVIQGHIPDSLSMASEFNQVGSYSLTATDGVVLTSRKITGHVECLGWCMSFSMCQTVNFNTATGECVLLNTKFDNMDLVTHQQWILDERVSVMKGAARLVGGRSPVRGRAEVWYGGHWGTVCDNGFTLTGWVTAFCKELGFTEGKEARYARATEIPQGEGHIALTNPGCAGMQVNRLFECISLLMGGACTHNEDVIVTCHNRCTNHQSLGYPCP